MYDSDKSEAFLHRYEEHLGPRRNSIASILELGVLRGGSLLYWRDQLPHATVAGLDWSPVEVDDDRGRIHVYQGAQQDLALLDRIAAECAPDGFDVIIDDASHVGRYTAASFWHLYPRHLRAGGLYVIEDWGAGYWSSYSDGRAFRGRFGPPAPTALDRLSDRVGGLPAKVGRRLQSKARSRMRSHDAGLVGFVKQLVDLTAAGSIAMVMPERVAGAPEVDHLVVYDGQVFVFKP